MWRQLAIRPEGVPEHTDVAHQHLFTEDPVYSVPDLSEIHNRGLKTFISGKCTIGVTLSTLHKLTKPLDLDSTDEIFFSGSTILPDH